MLIDVLLLLIAFLIIWLSTDYAIGAIEKLSHHHRLSRFTFSLFVVGLTTSFPELAVTVNAVILNSPQIALGSLIGSQLYLLFLVIPILAIMNQGLRLHSQMRDHSLIMTLLVATFPILMLLDQSLSFLEVLIILGSYTVFVLLFFRHSFLERILGRIQLPENISPVWEILKLVGASAVLMLAAHTAVREMVEISSFLNTPRFLLSLLILPIATNLPELSFALRSVASPRREFALGDYMGAIIFNSLLIGILALLSGGSISIGQNISYVVVAFVIGVIIFWWCCFSREILNIREGLLLFLVYLILLGLATWQIMSGIFG